MMRTSEISIAVEGGTIPVRVLRPGPDPVGIIVYYHGGGWVLGDLDGSDTMARQLAARTDCTVVLVDYRLAPEHAYPVPVEDSWTALCWVEENQSDLARPDAPLIVMGDSSGGNLAAVMTHRARSAGAPRIAHQILVYPVTDADLDRPSYTDPDNQLMVDRSAMEWFFDHYTPDPADRSHPEVSPLRAPDLSGLPPATVVLAAHDPLHDEGKAYAAALSEAGVSVRVRSFEDQMHGFFGMVNLLPGAAAGMDYVVERLAEALSSTRNEVVDAVVVGAGFGGLCMLKRLRDLGMRVRAFETATDVGGTWHWNRYPGARCDVESVYYSYSFDPDLDQEWEWSDRYAKQPEILAYLHHVADRFDLRGSIQFSTTIVSAHWDDDSSVWTVTTDGGEQVRCRYLVTAAGCLSDAQVPQLPGQDDFEGSIVHTSRWPAEGLDVSGLRVAVVGTGSTGIQLIPQMAEQAAHVTVFQRTPHFSARAGNHPLSAEEQARFKSEYPEIRDRCRVNAAGTELTRSETPAASLSSEERERLLREKWDRGGPGIIATFADVMLNEDANDIVADFFRDRIREAVEDDAVAALLTPSGYPVGTKRICVDTDYFETYNRDNVTLVSIRDNPIEEITARGLVVAGTEHPVDVIVFATGFDAITGALNRIDIRGRQGLALKDAWAEGPRTYLGLAVAGFPNLFTITGPGSPSVLVNMVPAIEQHVDFIADLIQRNLTSGVRSIEPTTAAQDEWVGTVSAAAGMTLYPRAGSWYMGANIPGKPRGFIPFVGGLGVYRKICDQVIADGYTGFVAVQTDARSAAQLDAVRDPAMGGVR
ncbi:MAG: alpha/beta hydrolase fold domain-containing protein [Nocardioides sp.]